MQMKMFVHKDPHQAENELNEWLKEHDVKLHHVVQSQSENQGKFLFVVSVFYENHKQMETLKNGMLNRAIA